ncbi:MAG TPA: SAM-dependent methyltransferase [Thermoanaerobacterales bacterium]|nr:SAM-dependent methyltransferase [Thermoanaerobacterales bacterium]
MNLSKRLQVVASKIKKGSKVADIGTDHAYLPIYIINKSICKRVIATEVRRGPYERALENIKKACLDDFIELRLGSGLKPIEPNETDIAVIAGMGGETILNILAESKRTADSLERLILQPMTNQANLRKYLLTAGYTIFDEDVAIENNKFYEVLVARKSKVEFFDDIDITIGPVLRYKRTLEIQKYLEYRMRVLTDIVESLKEKNTETSCKAVEKHERLLKIITEVLK